MPKHINNDQNTMDAVREAANDLWWLFLAIVADNTGHTIHTDIPITDTYDYGHDSYNDESHHHHHHYTADDNYSDDDHHHHLGDFDYDNSHFDNIDFHH